MEKSKCKNENRPNPNPEFSYFCGFLFFDPVIPLCLFRSFILQGGMRAFSIVEGDKMGDSPHQIRFRRIMPAVQFFLFENGKERFRNRIVMGASCPGKRLFYSKVLQQVNERIGHILRSPITMEHELCLWLPICVGLFKSLCKQLGAAFVGDSIGNHFP